MNRNGNKLVVPNLILAVPFHKLKQSKYTLSKKLLLFLYTTTLKV